MSYNNSGFTSSNQGGFYSTGTQPVGNSGFTSTSQSGPYTGGYQSTGGYHSNGGFHTSNNHQQITHSTQTMHGFFSPHTHHHREYVVHEHSDDRERYDLCCNII